MPNKKESLSIITVKTLLAVIIFAGIGTIIIGGGWLIGKQGNLKVKVEQKKENFKFIKKKNNGENVKEEKIAVISPVKGDVWTVGETYQIRWTPNNSDKKVTIQLLDLMKRGSYQTIWSQEVLNNGIYSFTVPLDLYPVKNAQLHIGNGLEGVFSEGFSIISADWKIYRDEKYGFEFKYPVSLSLFANGPNAVQKDLDAGRVISGTVKPSYETLTFRNKLGVKKFEISVFHKTDKALTEKNYENFFYTFGLCDLRWMSASPIIDIIQENGIPIIHAGLVNEKVPGSSRSCYYFKNTDNNLIVLSLLAQDSKSDYKATNKIVQNLLSTFKFIEKDETIDWKTYRNGKYGYEIKYPDNWDFGYSPKEWEVEIVDKNTLSNSLNIRTPLKVAGSAFIDIENRGTQY